MSNPVPIDEFVNDPGYPAMEERFFNSPWIAEPVSKFRAEDAERFWFLDFHWPKGTTPLGMCYFEDGYAFATQQAATTLPLPPSNGLAVRFGGVHVFGGECLLQSTWEPGFRGMRIGNELGGILERFNATWANREAELTAGFSHFRDFDTQAATMGEMAHFARDARSFQKFAWVTHFGLMYPLLANYAGFYGLCAELGIAPGEIAKFLQGEKTKIIDTDIALWGLTKRAKELGVAAHVKGTPSAMRAAMGAAGPNGATWLAEYDAFLHQWGWRCAGIADPLEKPWIEDQQQVVGLLETFLQKETAHDFDGGLTAAAVERDAAVEAARAKLTQSEQAMFDQALAGCRMANFSWWNEDHNVVIDMQSTIPLRRAATAIAEKAGAETPDDGCFLFHTELVELAEGKTNWKALKPAVQDRKDYYAHWNSRRKEMPKVVGTVPDSVQDPILIEIVGLHDKFLAAQRGETGEELAGIPASKGEVTGIAKVMHNADELHLLNPGDILVCEGTAPSWTPAFTKIGGCVCDNGGTLTHASIVSREYGLPCVVGTGVATSAIRTGDTVTVNGSNGTVQIVKRAA